MPEPLNPYAPPTAAPEDEEAVGPWDGRCALCGTECQETAVARTCPDCVDAALNAPEERAQLGAGSYWGGFLLGLFFGLFGLFGLLASQGPETRRGLLHGIFVNVGLALIRILS